MITNSIGESGKQESKITDGDWLVVTGLSFIILAAVVTILAAINEVVGVIALMASTVWIWGCFNSWGKWISEQQAVDNG